MRAALKAGEAIAHYYAGAYTIQHKSKDQPVTEADREANAAIQAEISAAFPDDGWLSEESIDDLYRLKKKRVWIIDPLDGTKEFIANIPEFAVSIGLVVSGKPVVGVIYNPITKDLFSAILGGGAFKNGKTIQVSAQTDFSAAKMVASRSEISRGEWKPYEGKFEIVVSGGMAWKMALVAQGAVDGNFSLSPKNEWDFCAGTLLVAEAGGVVADPAGKDFQFNQKNPLSHGIICANPLIYPQILNLLKKTS